MLELTLELFGDFSGIRINKDGLICEIKTDEGWEKFKRENYYVKKYVPEGVTISDIFGFNEEKFDTSFKEPKLGYHMVINADYELGVDPRRIIFFRVLGEK